MRKASWFCATVAALALTAASFGAVVTYNFGLDGLQETPPHATTGWGTATVTLDTVSGLLTWDVAYFDLIGTSTAAHFHGPAPPGEPAGIRVDMGGSGQFGGNSGTLIGSTTISQAFVQEVLDGLWYINIHSTMWPGGEIRGQVVPAPGALAAGAAALLLAARRRR